METFIVRAYAIWSLIWVVLLVVEWVRARRPAQLARYFGTWFAGAVVLAAARLILT